MVLTNSVTEMGIKNGLERESLQYHMLGGYYAAYIRGYQLGFVMRKAGLNSRTRWRSQGWSEEQKNYFYRLLDLCRTPRYARNASEDVSTLTPMYK